MIKKFESGNNAYWANKLLKVINAPINFADQKRLNNAYLQELTNGLKNKDS